MDPITDFFKWPKKFFVYISYYSQEYTMEKNEERCRKLRNNEEMKNCHGQTTHFWNK